MKTCDDCDRPAEWIEHLPAYTFRIAKYKCNLHKPVAEPFHETYGIYMGNKVEATMTNTPMTSREDDLIKVGGVETVRSKAREILDAAEIATADLTESTDKAFAKEYFCLGYQASQAQQASVIAELVEALERLKEGKDYYSHDHKLIRTLLAKVKGTTA